MCFQHSKMHFNIKVMLILKNLDTTESGSKQIRLLQPYCLLEVITNMASFF